jgi:hypothetical protein
MAKAPSVRGQDLSAAAKDIRPQVARTLRARAETVPGEPNEPVLFGEPQDVGPFLPDAVQPERVKAEG